MKYIEINNKRVSAVAMGTADFGGTVDEGRAFELMDTYAEKGGTFLDTAHVYGDFATPRNGMSEKAVGKWMEHNRCRERIFLSTKGAHHVLGTEPVGRLSREELKKDSSESLECLMTDRVDIYWLHRDNPAYEVGEVMENLQELIERGVTSLIGASNWSTKRIAEANEYALKHGLTPFYGNQPQFSLAIQNGPDDPSLVQADGEMLLMHKTTGMLMTPYSSQAKGFLAKLDTLGEAALPEKTRRRFLTKENLAIYGRTKQVSNKLGVSVAALSIAWLISQPYPLIPIVGASSPKQLASAEEAVSFTLSPEDRDYIRMA